MPARSAPGPIPGSQHDLSEPHQAGVGRGRAGHDPGQGGRSRPTQPGDADPLPSPNGQRDVAEEHARRGVGHAVDDQGGAGSGSARPGALADGGCWSHAPFGRKISCPTMARDAVTGRGD
jgi:hypothetical protein